MNPKKECCAVVRYLILSVQYTKVQKYSRDELELPLELGFSNSLHKYVTCAKENAKRTFTFVLVKDNFHESYNLFQTAYVHS